ncbi:hypothetical protein ANACOL_03439 [Anaerotruncus colihominis DSM 17241]|uniref:Uncharacterized protein n=1 Tax=Anaerotruncus colihominis DSM 17241 TaxID=445972 RepID=B0PF60_9FIRM|nr:hypothetical protein ANACOL_03439 [Anaerotruncus colihominis DSM 17241]
MTPRFSHSTVSPERVINPYLQYWQAGGISLEKSCERRMALPPFK